MSNAGGKEPGLPSNFSFAQYISCDASFPRHAFAGMKTCCVLVCLGNDGLAWESSGLQISCT